MSQYSHSSEQVLSDMFRNPKDHSEYQSLVQEGGRQSQMFSGSPREPTTPKHGKPSPAEALQIQKINSGESEQFYKESNDLGTKRSPQSHNSGVQWEGKNSPVVMSPR